MEAKTYAFISISEHLEEMIKQECKRRNTDFSSFMRAAALGAMRNRTFIVAM